MQLRFQVSDRGKPFDHIGDYYVLRSVRQSWISVSIDRVALRWPERTYISAPDRTNISMGPNRITIPAEAKGWIVIACQDPYDLGADYSLLDGCLNNTT